MNGIGAHTGQTYIQTFIFIYKDADEMISSATLCIPSFIKVGSTIQKLARVDMKKQINYKQI
jgi:hypothetical protein